MADRKVIKVCNHGPSPLVLRGGNGQINLELGAQHVDAETLAKVLESKSAKTLFEAQCTAHPEQADGTVEEVPAGPVLPIQKLSIPAAKKAIDKVKDVAVLKQYAMADARTEVRKYLQLRWRELVPEAEGADIQVG
jgi:hypothetical protein